MHLESSMNHRNWLLLLLLAAVGAMGFGSLLLIDELSAQFLTQFKVGNPLARNFYAFSTSGITALACFSIPQAETTEPTQLDAFTGTEGLDDALQESVH